MNIKDIYDTVTLSSACSHNAFLTHLDSTINYLIGRYGKKNVFVSDGYQKPRTIDTDVPIYDEYKAALCDNIIYLLTSNADRKTDFTAEADYAYKTVYSMRVKGKRILDGGYYHV